MRYVPECVIVGSFVRHVDGGVHGGFVNLIDLIDTIISRIAIEGDCWVWQRGKTGAGYGVLHINRKGFLAHRIAYAVFVDEIPTGKMIDHLCRNRACVNPDHLEIVTNTENQRRGNAAKLTAQDVEMIKTRALDGVSQHSIAAAFGVHQSSISKIVNNKTWRLE